MTKKRVSIQKKFCLCVDVGDSGVGPHQTEHLGAQRTHKHKGAATVSTACCSLFVPSAQVKSEYAQLKDTLGAVTQERDLALWEKTQLQGKLENLEQVLKVRSPDDNSVPLQLYILILIQMSSQSRSFLPSPVRCFHLVFFSQAI